MRMIQPCNDKGRTNTLPRRVTAFTAACLIVSNMIGTGIFGTTGYMMRDLGRPWLVLLLWSAGGLFALLGAACYAELGAAIPRAGGEYVYIREAYGRLLGFLSGWTSLTIGFSAAIAANALLFASHLQELLAAPTAGWSRLLLDDRAIGLVMIWSLTLVHVGGVGPGGLVQRLLTVVKVGAIVALVAGGLLFGRGDWIHLHATPIVGTPGVGSILTAFLFVSFSYTGWNAAGYIAGEMKAPGRSIPRATLSATLCVTVLYVALNVVYYYALPADQMCAEPLDTVAHKTAAVLFGAATGRWITAMLCISMIGATSAMIWAGPRVYFSMAQDGVLPRFFAGTTESSGTPVRSIVLQSVWVSVLVVVGEFDRLLLYAGFVLIVFGALAVSAVFVLRVRQPTLERPYRVTGYPLTPALYIAVSLAVMWAAWYARSRESLLGVATVLMGVPFYLIWKRASR